MPLATINYKRFTWNRSSYDVRMGCCEASSLGDLQKHMPSRVWTDAADVGFWVEGEHEKRLFVQSDVQKNAGEITALVFTQADTTLEPKCRIIIFND